MAASLAPARPSSRIPGIEGLRALAASAIVLLHVWEQSIIGATHAQPLVLHVLILPLQEGVPLFFALSGFLLWRPVASAVVRSRPLPSVRRYARNRAVRILPVYWVVLLVTALVLQSAELTPLTNPAVYGAITNPLLLAKNALLLQNYTPGTTGSGISPAWSLAVELVFYAVLPVLALAAAALASRSGRLRRRVCATLAPAGLLLVLGLAGKLLTSALDPGRQDILAATWHSVLDRSFLTHADLFAFGMVVAVMRVLHEDGRLSLPERTWPIVDRALVYGALPFLFMGFLVVPNYVFEPIFAAFCALLLARVVLAPLDGRPSALVRLLERRPVVAVGKASYSVFLWNMPICIFLLAHGIAPSGVSVEYLLVDLAIIVPVVGILSTLTYLGIERPAMRARRAPAAPDETTRRTAVAAITTA